MHILEMDGVLLKKSGNQQIYCVSSLAKLIPLARYCATMISMFEHFSDGIHECIQSYV